MISRSISILKYLIVNGLLYRYTSRTEFGCFLYRHIKNIFKHTQNIDWLLCDGILCDGISYNVRTALLKLLPIFIENDNINMYKKIYDIQCADGTEVFCNSINTGLQNKSINCLNFIVNKRDRFLEYVICNCVKFDAAEWVADNILVHNIERIHNINPTWRYRK